MLPFLDIVRSSLHFMVCRQRTVFHVIVSFRSVEMQFLSFGVFCVVVDQGRCIQYLSDELLPANYRKEKNIWKQLKFKESLL